MFARTSALVFLPQCGQVRNMATLKDITIRLKSIKNIQKITKSMKMVAAAKYARAERQLKPARVYGNGASALYEKAEIKAPEGVANKHLLIGVSSDRGLCGAVHSIKNASEMIDKLTLTFNRTRQAVITKELIEIISGAAAL
uniref:ATP synthase F(1) complex subunit gamma, mitochondrial n=1 Tax=Salmo salar TaxID=8030 RepID=B5X9Q3_SALSA|nr:ATP synthase subunit gamma, mitochondrial precursor [Salmo salar]